MSACLSLVVQLYSVAPKRPRKEKKNDDIGVYNLSKHIKAEQQIADENKSKHIKTTQRSEGGVCQVTSCNPDAGT